MIYIAHRGLTHGPNKELENKPEQIEKAISEGFYCEVDLWALIENNRYKLFLGHDEPQYEVTPDFLTKKGVYLWVHAKNLTALSWLVSQGDWFNYFWHQTDDFTLTSRNFIWTYPGKKLTNNSICVMPEWNYDIAEFNFDCYGVCSDYVALMKK